MRKMTMNGTNMNNAKKWEIWFAGVMFEDTNQIKKRPVLIIDDNLTAGLLLTLKMTSKPPRNNFYGEYPLKYWSNAGLKKPTTVRVSKKILMSDNDLQFKIGKIDNYDIINIENLILNEKKIS